MKSLLFLTTFLIATVTSLNAKNYELNLVGQEIKENFTLNIDLQSDANDKIVSFQRFNVSNNSNIKNLKIITAPGLKGTLVDEREVVVFYKTSLSVAGMKIRNLYKVGVGRAYEGSNKIDVIFDKDHYQNIYSFLNYHNIKRDVAKDLDNTYGTWLELL